MSCHELYCELGYNSLSSLNIGSTYTKFGKHWFKIESGNKKHTKISTMVHSFRKVREAQDCDPKTCEFTWVCQPLRDLHGVNWWGLLSLLLLPLLPWANTQVIGNMHRFIDDLHEGRINVQALWHFLCNQRGTMKNVIIFPLKIRDLENARSSSLFLLITHLRVKNIIKIKSK